MKITFTPALEHAIQQEINCQPDERGVDEINEDGECSDCAKTCDYCQCVCMGDRRCISCGGRCTCGEKLNEDLE